MDARVPAALLALMLLGGAAPSDVASTRAELATARDEAQATKVALALLVRRVAATEARAGMLETRIAALDGERRSQRAQLAARQDEVTRLLASLQTLSRRPAAFMLAQPQNATDAARLSLLLDALVPQLRRRTALLRSSLERSAETRKRLAAEREQLRVVRDTLAGDVSRLDAEGRALAARAASLEELLDGMTPDVPPPPQIALLRPAQGRLSARFGTRNALGVTSPGLSWRTSPQAPVVAPADGRVAFTGPFRTYGRIVIIEHGGGVLSLLAGLGDAAVRTGQAVRAGDAIGTMGAEDPTLYLEVRAGGVPVDPAPLLSARRRSSQG
jgi:septal ring factor EnvC (AmiA/AmiB activator)